MPELYDGAGFSGLIDKDLSQLSPVRRDIVELDHLLAGVIRRPHLHIRVGVRFKDLTGCFIRSGHLDQGTPIYCRLRRKLESRLGQAPPLNRVRPVVPHGLVGAPLVHNHIKALAREITGKDTSARTGPGDNDLEFFGHNGVLLF